MGRLSGPFSGPADNFLENCDENQIWSERARVWVHTRGGRARDLMHDLMPAVGLGLAMVSRVRRVARGRTAAPTGSGFRHNFSKKCPHDLRRVPAARVHPGGSAVPEYRHTIF
jgi:hypothetical protein